MNSKMNRNVNRGRPLDLQNKEEQIQRLIAAARQLLKEKSYKSITIREVSALAKVNSAMVKYYFGSKEGLFIQTFEHMSEQNFALIQSVTSGEQPVKGFITCMVNLLNNDSGLARFLIDEILTQASSIREAFIKGYPSKIASLLPKLVEKELSQLGISSPVNTQYAAFNLMSMIMMPYIAAPIRQGLWAISDSEIAQADWIEHLYQQFIFGCKREEQ